MIFLFSMFYFSSSKTQKFYDVTNPSQQQQGICLPPPVAKVSLLGSASSSKLSKSLAPISDFRILVYCTSVRLSLAFVIDIYADSFFYASILDYLKASDSVLIIIRIEANVYFI